MNIKKIAVTTLISSLVVLTFMAVLSIWDVLSDDVAWKSIATMGVVVFASVIIIIVAKIVEKKSGSSGM